MTSISGAYFALFPALAFMLLGNPALETMVAMASVVVFFAALLFGYVVWKPAALAAPVTAPLSRA